MSRRDETISFIQRQIGCTGEESEAIRDMYIRERILRVSPHAGDTLVHGAFYDPDVLRNALKQVQSTRNGETT